MARPTLKENRFRLPRWGALLLGFGALFAGGARAASPDVQPVGTPPGSPSAPGVAADKVTIRSEGGKVYISQAGRPFEELTLGDTPEAEHFKRLLEEAGFAAGQISVPVGSTIVASGGGGLDGRKPHKPDTKGSGPEKPTTNDGGGTK